MRILRLIMALLPCLLIISCGGGGGPGGATVSGRVVDGYIEGAKVYIVPRGDTTITNAVAGPATTDAEGRFRFTGVSPATATSSSYQLLSIGGKDTALGELLPDGTVYTAPTGSDIVTPLTTLVMETARKIPGQSIDQAVANIAAVTGMDAESIMKKDPVAQGMSSANNVKSLALNTALMQLYRQNVMVDSGTFLETVDAIADQLKDGSSLPVDVVTLMTDAARSDSASRAKAEIITAGIHEGMMRILTTVRPQGAGSALDVSSSSIATKMQGRIHSFLSGSGGEATDVVDGINNLANAITNDTLPVIYSNMASAANISDPLIRNYIRSKVAEGGLAQLLGADLSNVPWSSGTPARSAAVARVLKIASVGRSAAPASTSDNPCAGQGSTPVTWVCTDLFSSTTCQNAGDFNWEFTCSANAPTSSTMTLTNFSPFGVPLSGVIATEGNTLTFTGLRSGTSTFNGSLAFSSMSDGSFQFSVLDGFRVTSSSSTKGWQNLVLDSLSRGKMIPADSLSGDNVMSIFLSGSGTPAGSTKTYTMALNYDRSQNATKSPTFTDQATVRVSGVITDGTDRVALENFGFEETRYYSGQLDENYVYKYSKFLSGNRVSTSKYGYASFKAEDDVAGIKFGPDGAWVSGNMLLY
jgi:hypothetical protein